MTGLVIPPATLTVDALPVVAWLPCTGRRAGEAVAVVLRGEPECAGAPFAVLRARPAAEGGWRAFDGVYDLESLAEAMFEAVAAATPHS